MRPSQWCALAPPEGTPCHPWSDPCFPPDLPLPYPCIPHCLTPTFRVACAYAPNVASDITEIAAAACYVARHDGNGEGGGRAPGGHPSPVAAAAQAAGH
ncbi:hypothetical protein Srufu_025310 [Streptomyces libani subsp. rufus]|nr:hypothetical protein Srufu_025310 [Streptomyces libani subsp. rufus]